MTFIINIIQKFSKQLFSIYGIIFFSFIYLPLLTVIFLSFNSNPINMMVWDGFTFDWYKSIFVFSTKLVEDAIYLESTEQLLSTLRRCLGDQMEFEGVLWREQVEILMFRSLVAFIRSPGCHKKVSAAKEKSPLKHGIPVRRRQFP